VSVGYRAVGWNRQKRLYDAVLVGGVALFLAAFVGLGAALDASVTPETLLIRGFGAAALVLLHVVLAIGPLCRLDPRFLPLLYNRRHLGVTMFLLAAAHGGFAVVQFHALGDLNPLVSVLIAEERWDSLAWFPFQPLGLLALGILFAMAATSHDFWLANLTPPVWKTLHMGVYAAYALVVAHVALGELQAERSPLLAGLFGLGLALVLGLHLAAARREAAVDAARPPRAAGGGPEGAPEGEHGGAHGGAAEDGAAWVDAGEAAAIPEGRARVVPVAGERVAVFRYGDRIAALSSVCQHQNGPLGEGRVIDGCITCPWHGYQYRPEDGCSPPPFTERVATFRTRIRDGRVLVDPRPLPRGTPVAPSTLDVAAAPLGVAPEEPGPFYVGYLPRAPAPLARRMHRVVLGLGGGALLVALVLAASHRRLPLASFEFGVPRELEGVLRAGAAPRLVVARPGRGAAPAGSSYLLVAPGKHGAGDLVAGLDGRRVRLRGTLAWRAGETLVEVEPGSVRDLGAGAGDPAARSLGRFELVGEIVDGKCWMGVMNPGNLKPHRACAARCIAGGIPPVLCTRDADGNASYLLLVSRTGQPVNEEVLPYVAEPVRVTGEVEVRGSARVLRMDPGSIERIRPERR